MFRAVLPSKVFLTPNRLNNCFCCYLWFDRAAVITMWAILFCKILYKNLKFEACKINLKIYYRCKNIDISYTVRCILCYGDGW